MSSRSFPWFSQNEADISELARNIFCMLLHCSVKSVLIAGLHRVVEPSTRVGKRIWLRGPYEQGRSERQKSTGPFLSRACSSRNEHLSDARTNRRRGSQARLLHGVYCLGCCWLLF